MPPKTNTNPTKLAAVLTYFHKSGVAHSIKDLEKALPSIASINGMQVKDYLQALSDDSKIRVEKIGSGNWYWAFAGEERKAKENEIGRAEEERVKAETLVKELEDKVAEAVLQRGGSDGDGERTEALMRVDVLGREVAALKVELAAYSGSDPVVVERKKGEVIVLKEKAARWTEHVWVMEAYLRDELGMGREELDALKRELYDVEYSEEDGGLGDI